MISKRKPPVLLLEPLIPEKGARIGSVSGPGEFAKDNAGTVVDVVENRWGKHAVVAMDDGRTTTCQGLNRGPGIGWHLVR